MPATHDFEYYKPKTWDEAINLLKEFGSGAKILAGGTDLALKIKENIETPDAIIDIKAIPGVDKLEIIDGALHIGAGVSFSQIIDSGLMKSDFNLLWEASRTVASVGTRNRATVVGNICSAVPSLDSGPPLLVYEAIVNLISYEGKRSIPISEWFLAPKKTAIKPEEVVTHLTIPVLPKPNGTCYVKLGRYSGEDLAQAGVGIMILKDNIYRVAFCAVGPVPKRLAHIEKMLNGNPLTKELINNVRSIVTDEISPITDIRASKEYREHMSGIMLERGLLLAQRRCNGELIEPYNYLGG